VHHRREQGIVMQGMALGCTLLFALCALVIDLGRLRVAHEEMQRAVDLAALAAGQWLGNPGGRDPTAACEAALELLEANLRGGQQLEVEGVGCAALGSSCSSEVREVRASSAETTVTIRYPVTTEHLTAGGDSSRAHDGSACERLEVGVTHQLPLIFAEVLGQGTGTVVASAVVRGVVGYSDVRVPALHSLNRFGCGSISVSGQGRILVDAFDDAHPGVIGADSVGNTTGETPCTTNVNASGYVVFAQPWNGLTGIEAIGTPTAPSTIGLVATKLGSTRDVCCVPQGVRPAGTASPIISRTPVDVVYNPPVRPAVSSLRTDAMALTTTPVATLRGQGWVIFPTDDPSWSCTTNGDLVVSAARVVVDCAVLQPKSQAKVTFSGTDVVYRGAISVGSGNAVRMPNVSRVAVAGSPTTAAISVGGTFTVNDAALVGGPPRSCASRQNDASHVAAQLVVLAGGFTSSTSSTAHLCSTFLYMAGLPPPQQRTSGGTCAADLPCPITNADRGSLSLKGALDWRAANMGESPPDAMHPFEDLALWSESSLTSEIGGQGSAATSGVFFLPNAHLRFTGQASQDIKINAQFFSASFDMSGQGTLRLVPNPSDVVPVPVADFYLIR
jgi:hypothetical protein